MSTLAVPQGRVVPIDFWHDIDWHDATGKKVSAKTVAKAVGIAVPAPIPLRRPTGKSIKDWVVYASGKSQYYISKLLNQMFNGTSFSFPGTLYWALWTATLSASSTGSTAGEATYGSGAYVRTGVVNSTTNFSTSSAGSTVTNNTPIGWAANTGSAQTMTYVMIVDQSTTGNMIYYGSITSTTVNTGDTPQINTSGLTAQET